MTTQFAVDGHMHFWRTSENPWYPQLTPFAEQVGRPELTQDFMPAEYQRAADGLEVAKFVHVSATTEQRAYLAETAWVDALADEHALDLVIVGSVEPALPPDRLVEDLETQAMSSRFRGIRVLSGLEPGSVAARTLLGWLERNGFVFDLVTQPAGMAGWLDALEQFPGLNVVLEHTGWPSAVDDEGRRSWRAAIEQCAARTSAPCKITGLGMATADLSVEVLRPWIEEAVDVFGWDRVIYGSNMPIETMAGSYAQWIETLGAVLSGASTEEREKFYGANAAAAYRL